MRRLRNIVEADHRAVLAGDEPAIAEPDEDADGAKVVVADDRRRVAPAADEQALDRPLALLAGGQAIDDRSDRQAVPRQRLAIGLRAVARRRSVPSAADERNATVAELDQMFGGQPHAEAEVGADMVMVAPPEATQDLDDRHIEPMQTLDDLRIGSFRGAQQQPVDAMLAHPLDEAVLTRRRLAGIGEKRHPAGAIERFIGSRRQFGIERIGDFADDEPDGVGVARPEVGGGAIIDIAERVDRGLHARAGRRRGQRIVAQHERHGGGRNAGVFGDVLQGYARSRSHSRPAPAPAGSALKSIRSRTRGRFAVARIADLDRSKLPRAGALSRSPARRQTRARGGQPAGISGCGDGSPSLRHGVDSHER